MRHSFLRGVVFLISVLLDPIGVDASAVVVPDDYPSIQAGVDTGADTVYVRQGKHDEVVQAYRGVALLGLGGLRPQLGGLMISNPFDDLSKRWSIQDIDIMGPVTISTSNPHARLLDISFDRCRLGAGLQHASSDPYDIHTLSISDCRIDGFLDARTASLEMHSDTAAAGVSCTLEEFVTVDSCWFRGGSNEALRLGANDQVTGSVLGNVFEDTPRGMRITNCYQLRIESNVVRRASQAGMEIGGQIVLLENNDVSNCGVGLLRWFGETTLRNNRIVRTGGAGAHFFAPDLVQAESNVIGRCGGSGIYVQLPSSSELRVTQNTLFEVNGSGIFIDGRGGNARLVAEGNIVFGSVRWGLEIVSTVASTALRCNDWYANGLGVASGAEDSALDFRVDPGFCDLANDNVGLYSDSPLLTQTQCIQVGAMRASCSPPSLNSMHLSSSRGGLGVEWAFDAFSVVDCWIERAETPSGPWDSLGTGRMVSRNSFELLDGAVAPDRQYHYRVAWKDRSMVIRSNPAAGAWIDAGRLSSVSPNPAFGEVKVDWVLARPGATDVRVYDLAGREVSILARGSFGVGRHQVGWDGRWEGRGVAPAGMYVVRITNAERTTSHRILLLR